MRSNITRLMTSSSESLGFSSSRITSLSGDRERATYCALFAGDQTGTLSNRISVYLSLANNVISQWRRVGVESAHTRPSSRRVRSQLLMLLHRGPGRRTARRSDMYGSRALDTYKGRALTLSWKVDMIQIKISKTTRQMCCSGD